MDKSTINNIAMQFIKDKLSLNILNNIYEICLYFSGNLKYNEMDKNIENIKTKLPRYFLNIKNVLSLGFEERISFIKDIKSDIEKIEEFSLTLICFLKFSDLLTSIVSDYYQIKITKFNENIKFNTSKTLNDIYNLLDSEEKNYSLEKNAGIFLSLINFSMTKDNYEDYIKKSLKILLEGSTEKIVDSSIQSFKFKFAPFYFLPDNDDKKILEYISSLKYKDIDEDKLLEILENLDDISRKYSQKIGDISAIYGCFIDILSIYNFAIDKDYLFKDDFVLKDMFYYTCEMIENNNFNIIPESLINNLEEKTENLLKNIERNLNILRSEINKKYYHNFSDPIKICAYLDEYSVLNFEKNVLFRSKKSDENLATEEFVNENINEFLSFINNLKINNTFLKKLKQQFFFYIPCPLNITTLKLYLKNVFENLNYETRIIVSYKFLAFTNPERFSKYLKENYNHDNCCNHDKN